MDLQKNQVKEKTQKLIARLSELRDYAIEIEGQNESLIARIHPYYKSSARNLLHYLAIRTFELDEIQAALSSLGLSSLDHSEGYTLTNLENILYLLHMIQGVKMPQGSNGYLMDFAKSRDRLKQHAEEIFGVSSNKSETHIMVTMPSEAAHDKKLITKLLENGMTCARINCGHDSKVDWMKMIKNIRKISKRTGIPCKLYMDLAGPKLRTGPIESGVNKTRKKDGKRKSKKVDGILVKEGDLVRVFNDKRTGKPAILDKKGKIVEPASISVTLPAIFNDIQIGESIWIDDGKIEGQITNIEEAYFDVVIGEIRKKGRYLRGGRGINLPDTSLTLPSLTDDDLENLPLILKHADMVGYSFVRRAADVEKLQRLLSEYGREDIAIILKIETWDAFHNLPEILLTAMRSPKVGVMIARGDLAVEVGWRRMSELQEEILWLCEASHIPSIWATQILENLAKNGLATRSEITDAAMAARAECAMLNKGPYIVKAVKMLENITARMKAHQRKKMDTLRPLNVAKDFIKKYSFEEVKT